MNKGLFKGIEIKGEKIVFTVSPSLIKDSYDITAINLNTGQSIATVSLLKTDVIKMDCIYNIREKLIEKIKNKGVK